MISDPIGLRSKSRAQSIASLRGLVTLAVAACTLLSTSQAKHAFAGATDRGPNIILILADDLGYGDVQCYNRARGKIPTPNIDRLAAEGMRFTDAHSSSGVCSPSRYTLLTGRYHWRTRLQSGIVGYLERPLIAASRLTIPAMLAPLGYHTACIGKWHLGWDWHIDRAERRLFAPGRGKFPPVTEAHRQAWKRVYSRPIAGGPTSRGFDEYFGTDVPNWPPYCFIENDRTVGIPSEFLPKRLFRDHLASLPGPALHDWDLVAILPTLAARACDFVRRQAESKKRFFLYLPLTSPHTPLAVAPEWRGKSGLGLAVADFVMQTDAVVGQVMRAVRAAGIEQETLVIFTSDNGFAPYVGVKQLEAKGHYPSGPLRGYKGDAWEGGHRIPFIVRWPGKVRAGTTCSQLVHHADVMATIAAVVHVELPANAAEDSFNILPLLKGSTKPVRVHAVSQGSTGTFALRHGPWKMIFNRRGGGAWSRLSATPTTNQPAQLYDLTTDLGEQQNRYADYPERVAEMTALLQKIIADGRSTPGPRQKNDVPVRWRRFMTPAPK